MTKQSTYMPQLRGKSGPSNQKAWRGEGGWKQYLKTKALIEGSKNVAIGTAKSMSGLGANRTWPSRIGQFLSWWGLPAANKIANIEMKKDGGRVKGLGKAKRGFGRAMRKR